MLDLTDRHCRVFLRLFSPHIRMYTEMKVADAVIHGDRERFLGFDPVEHPVAIQLGGCDPEKLGFCSRLAQDWGYDEVNLNIGCPSDRVKSAQFGACLMAKPELVAQCVAAMVQSVAIPVTVKMRIGIDGQDSYEHLVNFVAKAARAGCAHFIVHARKAWLSGLSPRENRTIPPLRYDRVYRLKRDFPNIRFTLNGGITSLHGIESHLSKVDGVMMGRAAYQNPWILKQINDRYFPDERPATITDPITHRVHIVSAYLPYIEKQLSKGVYLRRMTRHMLGLFHGHRGARGWRRYLSEYGSGKTAGLEVIAQALKFVNDDAGQSGVNAESGLTAAANRPGQAIMQPVSAYNL